MTERLFVRQITENHWQWRMLNADGSWGDEVHAGTIELLAELIPSAHTLVCVIVPGSSSVVRKVPLDGVDKKLLAKMLPYEMEEEIIDPVEDLHFCFGKVVGDHVDVLYVQQELIEPVLEEIDLVSSEVRHVVPDFLALDLKGSAVTLVLEDEMVVAKYGENAGFSVEINIAPMVLEGLSQEMDLTGRSINLVADSSENIEVLYSCLPSAWQSEDVEIRTSEAGYWDSLDGHVVLTAFNLRSGGLALRLPIDRWWKNWKSCAYVAAAAFVLSLGVNFFSYLSVKSEGNAIRKEMEAVYLKAVPKGRRGDEERRLEKILKKQGGGAASTEPTNLTTLLSGLSASLEKQKDVQLSNFRYNGDQKELQVNLEVKGLNELGRFRQFLTDSGVESDSPRTSRRGDVYQASIKLSEAN